MNDNDDDVDVGGKDDGNDDALPPMMIVNGGDIVRYAISAVCNLH